MNISTNCFAQQNDSIAVSSTKNTPKSSIESVINYHSEDSIKFDVLNQRATLYGKAHVDYGEIVLDAAIITIDWSKKTLLATYGTDENGEKFGTPHFRDGEDLYVIDTVLYNYDTKKGYISRLMTEQSGGFLGTEAALKDENDILYAKNATFCPCEDSLAGTYIKSNKIKVIPNKRVYTGPFQLYVEDIPTPLVGPFGMFPMSSKKSSGIIIPTYGEQVDRGFYLRNGGFYWATSDYIGIKFLGEVYSNGGWGASAQMDYRNRYRFDGNLDFIFRRVVRNGDEFTRTAVNDYKFIWNHTPKVRGSKRFSANVEYGTTSYNQNNARSTDGYLENTLSSNINYSFPFGKSPFRANLNLRHNQNNQTGIVNFSLPDASITMARQYPFKRSSYTGRKNQVRKAIESINVSYTMNLRNEITTAAPSDFPFDVANIEDLDTGQVNIRDASVSGLLARSRSGIKHTLPVNGTAKFGQFNFNYGGTYTEIWAPTETSYEVLANDSVIVNQLSTFNRASNYSARASVNTRLYGLFALKGKRNIQVRHVFTPNVGYSYSPDYTDLNRFDYQQRLTFSDNSTTTISSFRNAFFTPSTSSLSSSITFGMQNNLEMKYRTFSDTSTSADYKYLKLIDNFSMNSSYNMAADSLKLAIIRFNANTKFLNRFDLRLSGSLNPYVQTTDGEREINIDQYRWNAGKGLLYLENLSFTVGTRLNRDFFRSKGENNTDTTAKNKTPDNLYFGYVDYSVPWTLNVNYTTTLTRFEFSENTVVNSLRFDGDFSLTEKWRFQYSASYDFENKEFVYPNVAINRDLNCWQMRLSWVPFGPRASYEFYINIKSSMLSNVLKFNRRNDFYDR